MKGPVVLLTTGLAQGGAERQVVLLACELSARGWQVHVVSMLEPSAFEGELAEAGIELHSLGMRAGRADPAGAVRLGLLLRKVRPVVLHCHLFHANLLGRLARLAFPIPRVICTVHSLAESSRESAETGWRDRLYRVTDRLADVTVGVSSAVIDRHVQARAVSPRRAREVPNGVDTEMFRPDAARKEQTRKELGAGEGFVWLAAGRLMWKKDYATMLRAAARVPGCVLWVAGDGPMSMELRALGEELKVRVRWLGARSDMAAVMNAADGFVLSSVVEGLPMVLLEAAASGLPCVSTAAGGAGDIVVDSETGFLTPCGDAGALGQAMARVVGMDEKTRAEMGRAARLRACKNFDLQVIVSRWEELYHER